jgi:hypothetical protein
MLREHTFSVYRLRNGNIYSLRTDLLFPLSPEEPRGDSSAEKYFELHGGYEVSSAYLTSLLLVDITPVSLGSTTALSAFLTDKNV